MIFKPYDDLIWHTADGRHLPYYVMATEHLQNCKAWMDREAALLRSQFQLEMLTKSGEVNAELYENVMWFFDPLVWIRQTPAYNAIVKELRRRTVWNNLRAGYHRARQQRRLSVFRNIEWRKV